MEVTGFRNGSIITDIYIQFASTSAPNNTDIENVLINAAPNITAFNITNVVVSDPVASTTTTMTAPTNATTANLTNTTPGTNTTTVSTTASSTPVNATTPIITTPTNATTVSPTTTTTVTTTIVEAVTTKQLQFRDVGATFTPDLENSSSSAFTERARQTVLTLEPFYKTFPSFRSMRVIRFRNGSIISDVDIDFASISVPNNTEIENVLINAAPNITTFNISTESVIVSDPVVLPTTVSTTTPMMTTPTNATIATLTNTTPGTNTTTVSTTASTTPVNAITPMMTTPTNATTANLTNTTPGTNTTTVSTTASTTPVNATTPMMTTPTNATTANLTNTTPGTNTTTVSTTASTTPVNATTPMMTTPTNATIANLTNTTPGTNTTTVSTTASTTPVNATTPMMTTPTNATIANLTNTTPGTNTTTVSTTASTTPVNATTPIITTPTNASTVTPTTTTAVRTTTIEAVTTKQLQFRDVGATFTPDLENSSSSAFTERARQTVLTLEPFYKTFPSFRSMRVIRFRNGSIISDVNIDFASISVPNNTEIENVLINAVSNITTFNISKESVIVSDPATPTTTLTATTTTTATPTTTTTAATTTAATATTATPTTTKAVTTTTAEPVQKKAVQFRSVNGIFITDLLTSSSTAFKERASLIETALKPFYLARFPSFRSINVTAFSKGSIINNMDIGFAMSLVPNAKEIAQVLIDAAKITPFDIDISSILVDGILSHGVSHKISLLTASCMVLLSWLLSGQQ
ncbi:mucin-17-like [Astatotilapia calliptera]|uniref:mucin-17-like n=1 Tax=Astatotilapia calliptera TaxID=8154 RepID=UPI000E41FA87|nr:mucin-17-like [Astatotilapia calliptera]